MNGISGVSERRFRDEDNESLKKEDSSSSVVKRDTGAKDEIHGRDRTWGEVKDEQKSHVGLSGGAHVGHAAVEGGELVGIFHLGAAGVIGGAAAGLAFGIHEIVEAHAKGDEQKAALARDTQHVALTGVLQLPESYKKSELDGRYKDVPKGFQSESFKMAEKLRADTNGLATLQHHADCGMKAGADCITSGGDVAKFVEANPNVKSLLEKDPAFRKGFEAYISASKQERADAEAGWKSRDARSTQPQTVRG